MSFKKLLVAAALFFCASPVLAQTGVQFTAGTVWGNSTAATRPGKVESVTAILDRALGSTRGAILERGASAWGLIAPGTSGLAFISQGAGADPIYGILGMSAGGCNAALTASNGGMLYSTATACAILNGTATARLPLLSGANTAPVWGAYTLPASVTSGGVACFTSTTVQGSSALLTANAIVLGGGAGVCPSPMGSLGTTTTVLHGNAGGAPTFAAIASADMSITATSCTNQFVSAISTGGVGTCTTVTLAGAQFANQGTTTTLLHGNAAGNPAFGQVVFADIASAALTTGAQLRSGTASTLLAADIIFDAEQTITFAGTQTWDFSTFLNARETLTANITALTCSNIKASQSGVITLVQDGTGSRTMVAAWCSQFRWAAGSRGVLSTAISAIDALFYQCVSTTICYVSLSKAQAN